MELMLDEQDMRQALSSANAIRFFVLKIAPKLMHEKQDKGEL